MESRCLRVKLKPNSIKEVKGWFLELNRRKSEVLETLKNEGIVVEAAFLDDADKENLSLIYFIKSSNLKNAMKIFKESILPIDIFYKENWFKYCLESVILEPLLDVDLLEG